MKLPTAFADAGGETGGGLGSGLGSGLAGGPGGGKDALGVNDVVDVVDVGYGGGLTSDIVAFGDSMAAAAARLEAGRPAMAVTEVLMEPLGAIDREASALGEMAASMQASGNELTPSELVTLTMHSQEFMFHSQLTANVANRTADGLQQLFRQQG